MRRNPAAINRTHNAAAIERDASSSVPFRKAYLQSLIDSVEVDDTRIRIKGSKDLLE
jgi:hypothetical protein